MSAPLELTAAILGVIALHSAWRGWRRYRARRPISPAAGAVAGLRIDRGWLGAAMSRIRPEARTRSGVPGFRRVGDDTPSPRRPVASTRQGRTAGRFATVIMATGLILVSPALAVAPDSGPSTLSVEPGVADAGSRVSVLGAGFDDHLGGVLALDGDTAGMPGFTVRTNGTFEQQFNLPANLIPGLHVVSAHTVEELATVAFTVVSPSSLAPTPIPTSNPVPVSTPLATTIPVETLAPSNSTPTPVSNPIATAKPVPAPTQGSITHVIVVWMENEEATAVTSASMPYLVGLSQTYGRADQYRAIAHPSLPNYLAFWSGSTQGVTDNGEYNLSVPSLSSQMTAAGGSWRTYAQNYPSTAGCSTGASYSGGVDGWGVAGDYVRRHNPAMSFTSVSGSAECANIQPLARFDPNVNVAFVVPNLCNDMHDCSAATGDAFLRAFLPGVFNAPDWAHTLLVVSFDEGSSSAGGGGRVFTMVARPGLAGLTSSTAYNHYGLLRTIQNIFGLSCLKSSCSATPLSEFLP